MGNFLISIAHWPVVLVTYPSEISEADIDVLAAKMRPHYTRAMTSPMVTVSNLFALKESAPRARAKLAEVTNAAMAEFPGAKIGEAVVAASQIVRTMISAHYLFRRDKTLAHKVFETDAEAIAWACELLAKHAASGAIR